MSSSPSLPPSRAGLAETATQRRQVSPEALASLPPSLPPSLTSAGLALKLNNARRGDDGRGRGAYGTPRRNAALVRWVHSLGPWAADLTLRIYPREGLESRLRIMELSSRLTKGSRGGVQGAIASQRNYLAFSLLHL